MGETLCCWSSTRSRLQSRNLGWFVGSRNSSRCEYPARMITASTNVLIICSMQETSLRFEETRDDFGVLTVRIPWESAAGMVLLCRATYLQPLFPGQEGDCMVAGALLSLAITAKRWRVLTRVIPVIGYHIMRRGTRLPIDETIKYMSAAYHINDYKLFRHLSHEVVMGMVDSKDLRRWEESIPGAIPRELEKGIKDAMFNKKVYYCEKLTSIMFKGDNENRRSATLFDQIIPRTIQSVVDENAVALHKEEMAISERLLEDPPQKLKRPKDYEKEKARVHEITKPIRIQQFHRDVAFPWAALCMDCIREKKPMCWNMCEHLKLHPKDLE